MGETRRRLHPRTASLGVALQIYGRDWRCHLSAFGQMCSCLLPCNQLLLHRTLSLVLPRAYPLLALSRRQLRLQPAVPRCSYHATPLETPPFGESCGVALHGFERVFALRGDGTSSFRSRLGSRSVGALGSLNGFGQLVRSGHSSYIGNRQRFSSVTK